MSSSLRNEIRSTLKLALPIVATQVSQLGMVLVDNIMVGHLGAKSLAAMAIATPFYAMLFVSAIGFLWTLSPLISHAHGEKNPARIAAVWKHGARIALLFSFILILCFQFSDKILLLLGQNAELIPIATTFLKTICWGIPGHLGFITLRQLTEGTHNSKAAMIVGVLGFLLNFLFDYIFIYGNWGFPMLGVVGSGLATALVGWLMFFALSYYVHAGKHYKDIVQFKKITKTEKALYKEITKLGLPIAGTWLGEISFFSSAAFLMGWIGTMELAAHQIAMNAAGFAFMVPMGISMATSVRVGNAMGQKNINAAKQAGHAGFIIATAFMSVTATLFLLKPEWVVGVYTQDPQVLKIGSSLLMIAGVFQLFDGLQVAGVGALRGLKDTRIPFINALIAYWLVGMPTSYLLGIHTPLQAKGIWLGMVAGLVTAATLHFVRFQKKITAQLQRLS